MRYSFFISYSQTNTKFAEAIYDGLNNLDQIVFVDRHKIDIGDDFDKVIVDNIKACDYFVILWSFVASDSVWVNKEIAWACEYKRKIVPFSLDTCPPHPLLKKVHHEKWENEERSVSRIRILVQPEDIIVAEPEHRVFAGYIHPRTYLPMITVSIYNPQTQRYTAADGILDSATQLCAIPFYLAEILGQCDSREAIQIRTISGEMKRDSCKVDFVLLDTAHVPYSLSALTTVVLPDIIVGVTPVILGNNFLRYFDLSINYDKGIVTLTLKRDNQVK